MKTKNLTILITLFLTMLSFSVFADSTGLVASYAFSGSAANDFSGNNLNGAISGAVSTEGYFGDGLSFDGTNDMVSVSHNNLLSLNNGMTLEAWVKPASVSNGWETIVLKERPTQFAGLSYALYAADGVGKPPVGYIHNGGDKSSVGTSVLPVNEWSHLATTYDGSRLKLYVNGNLVRDKAVSCCMHTYTSGNNPLRIGGNNIWGEFFEGVIDEVRVYNRALTLVEVQTDMDAPVDNSDVPTEGTYTVISNEPNEQVVAGQPNVEWLMQLEANAPNVDLVVELPVDATNVNVPGVDFTVEQLTDKVVVSLTNVPSVNVDIYYTRPGPSKQEAFIFVKDAKQVTVSSNIEYTNVLTRTKINPLPQSLVSLKHLVDGEEVEVTILNYYDSNGDGFIDEVEWIVPHLSTQVYQIDLNTAFVTSRAGQPDVPEGWYLQEGGLNDQDDICLALKPWILTNDTLTGNTGIVYYPHLEGENIGCGIKLPTFLPPAGGELNLTFYFRTNFTGVNQFSQVLNHIQVLNYGNDNCDIKFSAHEILEQTDCTAEMVNLTEGTVETVVIQEGGVNSKTGEIIPEITQDVYHADNWKRVNVVWPATVDELIYLFFTPPYPISGEPGAFVLENVELSLTSTS